MIKIENIEVTGWEHAIRGMRNPMNSWDKMDSRCENVVCQEVSGCDCEFQYVVGKNDFELMKKLANTGTDHRKFMRMITVYVDITAPMYWWKEFDTYKVGTVRNSCSTMHKIHEKEFTLDDFSCEYLTADAKCTLECVIGTLNSYRKEFVDCNSKEYWYNMIQLLPSSYNQRATLMLNYEVLTNMYHSRKNHKLDEWHKFCQWVETLPCAELIKGGC